MFKSFLADEKPRKPLRDLSGIEAERRVHSMMDEGYSPSQIDRKENLEEGTAHDLIACEWHRDKENAKRRKQRAQKKRHQ